MKQKPPGPSETELRFNNGCQGCLRAADLPSVSNRCGQAPPIRIHLPFATRRSSNFLQRRSSESQHRRLYINVDGSRVAGLGQNVRIIDLAVATDHLRRVFSFLHRFSPFLSSDPGLRGREIRDCHHVEPWTESALRSCCAPRAENGPVNVRPQPRSSDGSPGAPSAQSPDQPCAVRWPL